MQFPPFSTPASGLWSMTSHKPADRPRNSSSILPVNEQRNPGSTHRQPQLSSAPADSAVAHRAGGIGYVQREVGGGHQWRGAGDGGKGRRARRVGGGGVAPIALCGRRVQRRPDGLISSGFPTQKTQRERIGVLPAPNILVITQGSRTGELKAGVTRMDGGYTYNWQLAPWRQRPTRCCKRPKPRRPARSSVA